MFLFFISPLSGFLARRRIILSNLLQLVLIVYIVIMFVVMAVQIISIIIIYVTTFID